MNGAAPVAPPAAAGARGALLSQLVSGAPKLKKAVTNDRSAASVTGQVLGDTAPPPHINAAPRPVSPPSHSQLSQIVTEEPKMGHNPRQSVDWYANLAADGPGTPQVPETVEEEEEEFRTPVSPSIPDIQIHSSTDVAPSQDAATADDAMEDIDQSTGMSNTVVWCGRIEMTIFSRIPCQVVVCL